MSNICVIGTGYVGLVAIASFAEMGHRVVGLDIDEAKIESLRAGQVPFYEPGIEDLLVKEGNRERIRFTTEYADAVPGQDFVFLCVNTPPDRRGRPVMDQITGAARSLAAYVSEGTIVVNKSTGPVGMTDVIARVLGEFGDGRQHQIVANPEFLRQSHGVYDFLHPHQVIIGTLDAEAGDAVRRLYEPLGAPISMVEPRAAEMTKLASNAFRATKVSFANELASICERFEIDVKAVCDMLGVDKAIGPTFLAAGAGWGGNCLPKDVLTLEYVAKANGVQPRVLHAAELVNRDQQRSIVAKAERLLGDLRGKRIAALGLAFKGNTDDIRYSPAIGVVKRLVAQGANLQVHDPRAMPNTQTVVGNDVTYCDDPYEAARGADLVVLLTDCPEFRDLDPAALRLLVSQANFVDGRNMFDAATMEEAGFTYIGIGRGYPVESRGAEAVLPGRHGAEQ